MLLYIGRALRLCCPVCGTAPLFRSLSQMESPAHWFETLPGCPHCNYAYDRESGYFMMALWSLVYGPAALVGIGLLFFGFGYLQLSTGPLLLFTLLPTAIFALLIVRHAKALYLTIDLLFFHSHDEA